MSATNTQAEWSYRGRILRVDLSSGAITRETIDAETMRKYVGGNGIGMRILYDEVPPQVGPLDPENRLIFAAGALSGTNAPGSGIYSVLSKGPLSGGLVSAQANGFFGARMRHAGADVIVVQGAAPEWCYLAIDDEKVEIRPATHLLGLRTWECEDRIKEELGQKKASVACIGPAGENLVHFAAIESDHGHFAATNGPGAVMGSKKLKAIAVHAASSELPIFDKEAFRTTRKEHLQAAEGHPGGSSVKALGTLGHFGFMFTVDGIAIKNWSSNVWADRERWHGGAFRATYERRPQPCWRCPWAHCSEVTVTVDGVDHEVEEPEFEMMQAWTTNIGNADIPRGLLLSDLNDKLGMCGKEGAAVVGLAIECFEAGLLDETKTGGLKLTWGNTEAVGELLTQIAERRGFGALLADGVKVAAQRIGGDASERAVYLGIGVAPHVLDGRSFMKNVLFGEMTCDFASFGGSTGRDDDIGIDDDVMMNDLDEIAPAAAKTTARKVMDDALGLCDFFCYGDVKPMIAMLNAVTGLNFSIADYLRTGNRILALMRAFNVRNGIDFERMVAHSPRLTSPNLDGALAGMGCDADESRAAAVVYYTEKGWDPATGKPLPETLAALDLAPVAADLWA